MAPLALESTFNSSLLLCRSCRIFARNVRSLTITHKNSSIRPESPRFIEIPEPVQEDYRPKPRVKGTLPVPREIFPRRRPDKPSRFYLEDATPEPKPKVDNGNVRPDLTQVERIAWKRHMATRRRRNLREGLVELYQRKQQTDRAVAARSNYKVMERDHLISQATREDERLTNPTIIKAMQPVRGAIIPNPNGEQRLAAKREKAEAVRAGKQETRQDALQSLYLNARSFITNEEQLRAEIERVFPAGNNTAWKSENAVGENIWNLGLPPTIGDMLYDINQGDVSLAQGSSTKHGEVAQKRIGKIADALGFKT
jgi:hypothetical protein